MCVVAGLWPKEGAFQESLVAKTMVAAKSLDQSLLNGEDFIDRQELDDVTGQVGGPVLRFPGQILRGGPLRQGAAAACERSH